MSDPDVFLEAVRGVTHGEHCGAWQWVEVSTTFAPVKVAVRSCTCDRDERIARGLEAALLGALQDPEVVAHMTPDALKSFREAARG